MPSITYASSISGGGVTIQSPAVVRTGSASIGLEESLPAAETGSLTTRTDDDTGTITMDSGGHGITTGATVDVYWDGGVQYACTVGTVSGTSVPIDTGSGDNLPPQDTDVTVVVVTEPNISIDGDNVEILAITFETADTSLRTAAHIQFLDSGDAEIAEIDLVANTPQVWDIAGGSANPFTGNAITKAICSNGNSSTAGTLKIAGVADATP